MSATNSQNLRNKTSLGRIRTHALVVPTNSPCTLVPTFNIACTSTYGMIRAYYAHTYSCILRSSTYACTETNQNVPHALRVLRTKSTSYCCSLKFCSNTPLAIPVRKWAVARLDRKTSSWSEPGCVLRARSKQLMAVM